MKVDNEDKDVFYQCQRCGNCCRWPGDVRLTELDTVRIAEFLNLEIEEFVAKYTRLNANRTGLSLIENPDDSCVFLEGIECSIQPAKPSQCEGFPNLWNFPGWRDHCEAIPVPHRPGFHSEKKTTCEDGASG